MIKKTTFGQSGVQIPMMKNKSTAMVLVAVAVVAWGLTGVRAQATSQNKVAEISAEQLQALMQGKENGRHLLVAVASWCGPCRKELPVINRLFKKYQSRGLSVAAVSLDADGPKAMQPVVDELGLTFPVYWSGPKPARKYNIFGVPTLFLIKNGETVEKIIGQRSEKFLEEKIKQLMEE
jgi:thiol-disulfide isomerase/thioredoxin